MATRHRARLSIHMLESDRASILVKAGLNMDKLHGLDLVSSERAGLDWGLGIWERLQKSTEKLVALLQEEGARFMEMTGLSHRKGACTAAVQKGCSHAPGIPLSFGPILKTATALQKTTAERSKDCHDQNRPHALQTKPRLGTEQLRQLK